MKHNKDLEIVGTCLQGNLNLSYGELVEELGKPDIPKEDGGKTSE